jgi:hypothetical protein
MATSSTAINPPVTAQLKGTSPSGLVVSDAFSGVGVSVAVSVSA